MKARSLEMRLLFLLLMAGSGHVLSATECDSIRISLLTCSPHEEVYSLYGHSAIRYENLTTGADFVVNYGVFNFEKPYFILRFVFGLTDYEMGIVPYPDFIRYYESWNSGVTEQVLDLTPSEEEAILDALRENALPENREYRYNYFYDNCTTRARDMLVGHLDGKVSYPPAEESPSFRELVHRCTDGHEWAQFGNDMLLGVGADRPLSTEEQQFLPARLMRDFSGARLTRADGSQHPLLRETVELAEPGIQIPQNGFPLSPVGCFGLFFLLTIAITVVEIFTRKLAYLYDLLLMLLTGLAGILLFAMIFSQHPTVSVNLLLLLINPLPLFFLYPAIRNERRHESHFWWVLSAALVAAFWVGGIFQQYPTAIHFLALSLLLRDVSRLWLLRHERKK